jgi:flagellar biosynthesis chaperone FliJ
MKIETEHQLRTTRRKLALLEERYEELRQKPADNEHVRELTLQSMRRFINQLKEEIARFECHATSHTRRT